MTSDIKIKIDKITKENIKAIFNKYHNCYSLPINEVAKIIKNKMKISNKNNTVMIEVKI